MSENEYSYDPVEGGGRLRELRPNPIWARLRDLPWFGILTTIAERGEKRC